MVRHMAQGARSRRGGNPRQAISELWPGQSVALLKALHILTQDGAINADSRRKLKQVLHLAQLIKPALEWAFAEKEQPVLADLGAGKSYLGFVLYDLFFASQGRGQVYGIETRSELVQTCRRIAAQSQFDRMQFIEAPIADAVLPGAHADVVTALHACDTATDAAILFALRNEARFVALVPCCQAELAANLEGESGPLRQLWRHPIQRREFGAHLTNVMRGLFLEAQGYKVRVTELTGLEHSLKNEFIFAERHQRSNPQARTEFLRMAEQFGTAPALLKAAA
jgi:hypothetical protein